MRLLTRRTAAHVAVAMTALLLGLPSTPVSADPDPPVETFDYTSNMEPLGASLRPPPASGIFNSDLAFWGDLAAQGTYDGFRLIDISNPEDPQGIIDYDECSGTSTSNQGDVILYEDLLVRSWNSPVPNPTPVIGTLPQCDGQDVPAGFEGLHIFDITDRANPELLSSVDLTCGSHTATAVPDPANDRLLIYNSASTSSCPGIDIVQIPLSAPDAPVYLRSEPSGRSCHDTAVILGDAMLAACAGGNGLTVFSLGGDRGGSLINPEELWSKSLEGVSIGHAASFSWNGEIVVFGHEPGGGSGARCQASSNEIDKTLFFFAAGSGDELGRWVLPRPQTNQENCTIHNFNVVPSPTKNILVSGNYQSGISVVDFTNPAQAHEIAYADPAPLQPQQLGGDWSSHWYDGFIYESDITRGLITWRLNDPAVADAQTLGHLNPQTQEHTIAFTGTVTTVRCAGNPVTIFGTLDADRILGTAGPDVILSGDGDDVVAARKGKDVVCGGEGNDRLRGGKGRDLLLGQEGKDRLYGGRGKDRCVGGPSKDLGQGCEQGKV